MPTMITISDEDILRMQMIVVDQDADEALAFIRERILPQIKAQQGKTIVNHLDGGKGSTL